MFDIGVNQGIGYAGLFLQRSLNVLNHNGKDYPDLKLMDR
jgi:lysozyme family protein